jgi:hypothetical protein
MDTDYLSGGCISSNFLFDSLQPERTIRSLSQQSLLNIDYGFPAMIRGDSGFIVSAPQSGFILPELEEINDPSQEMNDFAFSQANSPNSADYFSISASETHSVVSSSNNSVVEREKTAKVITADELFAMDDYTVNNSSASRAASTKQAIAANLSHVEEVSIFGIKSEGGKCKRKKYTHITSDVNDSPIIDPKLLIDPSLPKKERNKISATAYRKRRKVFLDGLEGELNEIKEELTQQQNDNRIIRSENNVLREQLGLLKNLIVAKSNDKSSVDIVMSQESKEIAPLNPAINPNVKQASLMLFSLLSMVLSHNPGMMQRFSAESQENFSVKQELTSPLDDQTMGQLTSSVHSMNSGGSSDDMMKNSFITSGSCTNNDSIAFIINEVYFPLVRLVGAAVAEQALKSLASGVWTQITRHFINSADPKLNKQRKLSSKCNAMTNNSTMNSLALQTV